MNGVFVWIDQANGHALPASWEALGVGRTVADALGQPLTAVILGHNVAAVTQGAIERGAAQLLVADTAELADFRLDAYAAVLSKAVADKSPSVVIAAATTRGRELIATAAFDSGVAPLADVTNVRVENGVVQVVHPAYAGKVSSDQIGTAGKVQFVTTRSRAFPAPTVDAARTGASESLQSAGATSAITITGFEAAKNEV